MITPMNEQNRYISTSSRAANASAAAEVQKAAEATTQTVQASSEAYTGNQAGARQDSLTLSTKAQELLHRAGGAASIGGSGEVPTQGTQETAVSKLVNSASTQSGAPVTQDSGEDNTDLSTLSEQQISQLVSKGTITAAKAAVELAKRTAARTQSAGQEEPSAQANVAAQTGLILNTAA